MNKKLEIKRVLPTVILAAILVFLVGMAFLPVVRNGGEPVASSTRAVTETDAVRVYEKCSRYVDEHSFSTRLCGSIKARVLGIPYNVKVSGGREVSGDEFCDTAEGVSAMVKFAHKKRYANGAYSVARGEYKDGAFSYGDPSPVGADEYFERYGMPPTGLVKYAVENNIASAECRDENVYVYTLDAAAATEYYRREGKTVLGCDGCPEYKSVVITLVTDGERAIKVTAEEKFIAPKFGGISCTATFTELYYYS